MELIILLIAILVLSKIKNVNDTTHFRIVVGALMGISFLFAWPYIYYVTQILMWDESFIYVTYLLLLTVTMSFILAVTQIRINDYVPALLIVFFFVVWIITSIYDVQIKNKLADVSGYFDTQLVDPITHSDIAFRDYKSAKGAYTVSVPISWKPYKFKGSDLTYFRSNGDSHNQIEFRPRCFHPVKRSMYDTVSSMTSHIEGRLKTYKQCYHWNQDGYACKVFVSSVAPGNSIINRLRWLGINNKTGHAIELDFVLTNEMSAQTDDVIDYMISSVRLTPLDTMIESSCISVIDWL